MKENFDKFIRVGSLKKIAKPILNYTLQSEKGKYFIYSTFGSKLLSYILFLFYFIDTEAIHDLKAMLKEPGISKTDERQITKNIEDLESGDMKNRVQRLKEVRVVGKEKFLVF